jgi:hypothetical protein
MQNPSSLLHDAWRGNSSGKSEDEHGRAFLDEGYEYASPILIRRERKRLAGHLIEHGSVDASDINDAQW